MSVDLELEAVIGFGGNIKSGLIYHPNGRFIIYPIGTMIVIKDITTNTMNFLRGHSNSISCISLSRDGTMLASGQKTHMGFVADAIIWNLETLSIKHRLKLHKGSVVDCSFNKDDNFLATLGGRDDGRIIVWEIESGRAIREERTKQAVTVQWFHHHDEKIITGGSQVEIWSTNTRTKLGGKMDHTICEVGQYRRNILCIALDSEDKYMYCGTRSGDIMCIHTGSAKFKSLFRHKLFGQQGVQSIEYCEENGNAFLLAGCGDGTISLVELEDGTGMSIKRLVSFGGAITSISRGINFKGGLDTFIGTAQGNHYIINSTTLQYELRGTAHYDRINDICFPSLSSELFLTCSNNDIRIWNAKKRRELLRIQVPNVKCNCIALNSFASKIVSGWSDSRIRVFKPQTGKLDYVITNAHQGAVTAVTCTNEDDFHVVSGGADGRVRIWEGTKMIASLKEHKAPVNEIKMTKDNSEIVSTSDDGSIIVWDYHRHVRLNAFFDNTMFRSVVFHPDESQIITCGSDRKITYWDMTEGAIRVVEGSEAEINTLDIDETGTMFVSGANDKLVKVWDYNRGVTVAVGQGHSMGVQKVRLAPDQRTIASVGADGAIILWRMRDVMEDAGGEEKEDDAYASKAAAA